MPDINKQIEEQAKQILFKANKLPPEANYFGSVDHIKYSANEILKLSEDLKDSSRWRKASEELPKSGEDVLAKCECGSLEVSFKGEMSGRIVCNCKDCDNIVEWKPID